MKVSDSSSSGESHEQDALLDMFDNQLEQELDSDLLVAVVPNNGKGQFSAEMVRGSTPLRSDIKSPSRPCTYGMHSNFAWQIFSSRTGDDCSQ